MGRPTQIDWEKVKLDYCRNSTLTAQALADKFGTTAVAVRHQIHRHNWARARQSYCAKYEDRLTRLSIHTDAPKMLMALNAQVLKDSEKIRVILRMRVEDESTTTIELRCIVAAFAELYRMDRLALGASTDNLAVASTSANQYDNMSEEELLEELKQVRSRVALDAK